MKLNEERKQLHDDVEQLQKQVSNYIGEDQLNRIIKTKKELKREYKEANKIYKKKKWYIYTRKDVLEKFKIKDLILSGIVISLVLVPGVTLGLYTVAQQSDCNKNTYSMYDYTMYYNDGYKENIDRNNFEMTLVSPFYANRYDQAVITLKSPYENKDGRYERVISTYKLDCSENSITEDVLKDYVQRGYDYTKENLSSLPAIVTYEYKNDIEDVANNTGEVICEANILNNVVSPNNEEDNNKVNGLVLSSMLTSGAASFIWYTIATFRKRKFIYNQIDAISKNLYGFDMEKEKMKVKKLKKDYKEK